MRRIVGISYRRGEHFLFSFYLYSLVFLNLYSKLTIFFLKTDVACCLFCILFNVFVVVIIACLMPTRSYFVHPFLGFYFCFKVLALFFCFLLDKEIAIWFNVIVAIAVRLDNCPRNRVFFYLFNIL